MLRTRIVLISLCLIVSPQIFAAHNVPNHPHINNPVSANVPPGLQKKGIGTIPSFLGKTPPGWDEGLKRGWDKNKDWHWNKEANMWENKNWRWSNTLNTWERID